MHPAFSIIFFTSASGLGYGLLALLGILGPLGILPPDQILGFVALALALGAISAGLMSSAAHLGHPERALRAFSQWRSSWLSREGVASVATYIPAGLFGIGWVFLVHDRRPLGGVRPPCDHRRHRHGVLHGDDLPLAEADPALAQFLGHAELSRARADDRCALARADHRDFRDRPSDHFVARPRLRRHRRAAQARLLAVHRRVELGKHRRERDGSRRHRQGASLRGAAYLGELPPEGNGLQDRPQARNEAPPDRRGPGLRSAVPAVARAALRHGVAGGDRGHSRRPARHCRRPRRALAVLRRSEARGNAVLRRRAGIRPTASWRARGICRNRARQLHLPLRRRHHDRRAALAKSFGGRLAVLDVPRGGDIRRCLVSIAGDGLVTQQSAMSLSRPEKLVFDYEKVMALAIAAVPRPRTVLLLGLGGGAMARFLARYMPGCTLTLVERDPTSSN